MGIIKLFIMLAAVWMVGSSLVEFKMRRDYYIAGCDTRQCVRTGWTYVSQHELDVRKSSRERNFQNLCPDWRDANWFGRNVTERNLSWCADYVERL
jgi:hypothetical protein